MSSDRIPPQRGDRWYYGTFPAPNLTEEKVVGHSAGWSDSLFRHPSVRGENAAHSAGIATAWIPWLAGFEHGLSKTNRPQSNIESRPRGSRCASQTAVRIRLHEASRVVALLDDSWPPRRHFRSG